MLWSFTWAASAFQSRVFRASFCNPHISIAIVDNSFPCLQKSGAVVPAFTHSSKTAEVWVLVLEKAWAKLHGSYAKYVIIVPLYNNLSSHCRIEVGTACYALGCLTGAPAQPLPLRQLQDKAEDQEKYEFLALLEIDQDS
jgi:hypothetical protein